MISCLRGSARGGGSPYEDVYNIFTSQRFNIPGFYRALFSGNCKNLCWNLRIYNPKNRNSEREMRPKRFKPLSPKINLLILLTCYYIFPIGQVVRICLIVRTFLRWWSFSLLSWPVCLVMQWYCKEKLTTDPNIESKGTGSFEIEDRF